MLLKQLKFLSFALALCCVQCSAFSDDDNDDAALLAAAAIAFANSNVRSAALTITNNSGGTRTYTLHTTSGLCTSASLGTTGAVANGAVGSVSVQPVSAGINISDGTNCVAVETAKTAGLFTCTDPGGGGLSC